MKAMISIPLAGRTDEEIKKQRDHALNILAAEGYDIVNTLYNSDFYSKEAMDKRGVVNVPLCYLAKSMEQMTQCHVVLFCKGWENARGCKIEHEAAVAYGLKIIYEI